MKKHSKALVFFVVSKKIPIVYSADRSTGFGPYINQEDVNKSCPVAMDNARLNEYLVKIHSFY